MRSIIRRSNVLAAALAAGAAFAAPASADVAGNPHGSFVADCGLCHRPDAWKPVAVSNDFDHGQYGFRLEGSHSRVDCRACHASLDFKRVGSACIDCHQDIHQGELGADCARCHSTRNFIDQTDQRRTHRLTRFPLTGAHAAVDCDSCHRPGGSGELKFVNTRTDCAACHLDLYLATTSPDHVASGFPRDCSQCHSVATWEGSRFNHAATGFPLAGSHRSLDCSACHAGNQFQGASPDCDACHSQDYDLSANPGHLAGGFPRDCRTCHSTASWRPASFDHNTTAFPLTGAHRGAACVDCHAAGVYTVTSTACASCHMQDYDGAMNPDHGALGFSNDCSSCHSTTSWSGATFNHDASFFPIYSGVHAGRWSTCGTCHQNPANYTDFTCMACHPHSDKAKTDGNHGGISGYAYISSACYSCHPRGRN